MPLITGADNTIDQKEKRIKVNEVNEKYSETYIKVKFKNIERKFRDQ